VPALVGCCCLNLRCARFLGFRIYVPQCGTITQCVKQHNDPFRRGRFACPKMLDIVDYLVRVGGYLNENLIPALLWIIDILPLLITFIPIIISKL